MYHIIIKKKAKKFIDKLPRNKKRRVGEYRIVYTVDNGKLMILVIDAGNRGEIYNRY